MKRRRRWRRGRWRRWRDDAKLIEWRALWGPVNNARR